MKAHLVWTLSLVVAGLRDARDLRAVDRARLDGARRPGAARRAGGVRVPASRRSGSLESPPRHLGDHRRSALPRRDPGCSRGRRADQGFRSRRRVRRGLAGQRGPREKNRVVLDRGPLTEWYVNGPAGVEQGFVVGRRPPGEGRLAVELEVAGTSPSAVGAEVHLGRYRLRDLRAYDADRRPLPAATGGRRCRAPPRGSTTAAPATPSTSTPCTRPPRSGSPARTPPPPTTSGRPWQRLATSWSWALQATRPRARPALARSTCSSAGRPGPGPRPSSSRPTGSPAMRSALPSR